MSLCLVLLLYYRLCTAGLECYDGFVTDESIQKQEITCNGSCMKITAMDNDQYGLYTLLHSDLTECDVVM